MKKGLSILFFVSQILSACAVCDKFEAQEDISEYEKEAIKINQASLSSTQTIVAENRVLVTEWNFQTKKNTRACFLESLKKD